MTPHTVPTPIHTVPPDQAVLDLHRFDEVHLIAIGRRAWTLLDQLAAVGEEIAARGMMAAPHCQRSVSRDPAHEAVMRPVRSGPVAPNGGSISADRIPHEA